MAQAIVRFRPIDETISNNIIELSYIAENIEYGSELKFPENTFLQTALFDVFFSRESPKDFCTPVWEGEEMIGIRFIYTLHEAKIIFIGEQALDKVEKVC